MQNGLVYTCNLYTCRHVWVLHIYIYICIYATCAGGLFPSTHRRTYSTCARATCTVWWWSVVVVVACIYIIYIFIPILATCPSHLSLLFLTIVSAVSMLALALMCVFLCFSFTDIRAKANIETADTHTHTHTHLLLLCSPCPLGMFGGICLVLPQGDSTRLVGLVVTDDSPPFCTVLNCLSPVPYATKVVIDQVIPAQGCSTWRSFLSTWSASHKLSLGEKGWHPPNMSKPLQSSLS